VVFRAKPSQRPPSPERANDWGKWIVLLLVAIIVADFHFRDLTFTHLYYLPILLAAMHWGRTPALIVAGVSILFAHLAGPQMLSAYQQGDLVEGFSFVAVAIFSAFFVERNRELKQLATTDDLTPLHNLRAFTEQGEELLKRRSLESFSVVHLDVDHLKEINSRFGHLVGASVVQHVGTLIHSLLEGSAIACRYGGDEFVILVTGDEEQASKFARRILRKLREGPILLAGQSFSPGQISVSIGVASGRHDGHEPHGTLELLFTRSDQALYDAKAKGRGRICKFSETESVSRLREKA
jgi:diguanylate cyclase (GGDEF)-like protein